MGIPKKSSRNLLVDGKAFRYIIRHVGCGDKLCRCGKEQRVIVQEKKTNPGSVLVLFQTSAFAITPQMLREKLQDVLQKGWNPSARGKPLTVLWD